MICFEIAYDDVVRDVVAGGAEVIVVQTNNATFGGSAQPEQQFAISRLRAIETGLPVLVAATSGISGVIGPTGQVLEQTDDEHPGVIESTVIRDSTRTMSSRLGSWPEWVLAGLGLAGAGRCDTATTTGQDGWLTTAVDPARGRTLVIIPTYNERANIETVVRRVRAATPEVDVLVVDDNSPDGTGQIADRMAADDPQVHALNRPAKEGLGFAYLAGFECGLARGYDVLVEMDADGSHQPEQLDQSA